MQTSRLLLWSDPFNTASPLIVDLSSSFRWCSRRDTENQQLSSPSKPLELSLHIYRKHYNNQKKTKINPEPACSCAEIYTRIKLSMLSLVLHFAFSSSSSISLWVELTFTVNPMMDWTPTHKQTQMSLAFPPLSQGSVTWPDNSTLLSCSSAVCLQLF